MNEVNVNNNTEPSTIALIKNQEFAITCLYVIINFKFTKLVIKKDPNYIISEQSK